VDHVTLGIPNYVNIITNPMDLGTIQANLDSLKYHYCHQFTGHVRLIFGNAMTFNVPEHSVHIWAKSLLASFEKKFLVTAEFF
jgi:hypothetical protein